MLFWIGRMKTQRNKCSHGFVRKRRGNSPRGKCFLDSSMLIQTACACKPIFKKRPKKNKTGKRLNMLTLSSAGCTTVTNDNWQIKFFKISSNLYHCHSLKINSQIRLSLTCKYATTIPSSKPLWRWHAPTTVPILSTYKYLNLTSEGPSLSSKEPVHSHPQWSPSVDV